MEKELRCLEVLIPKFLQHPITATTTYKLRLHQLAGIYTKPIQRV